MYLMPRKTSYQRLSELLKRKSLRRENGSRVYFHLVIDSEVKINVIWYIEDIWPSHLLAEAKKQAQTAKITQT